MFLIAFVFFALAIIAICIYKSCDYEIMLYIGVIIIAVELVSAVCYALAYYPAEYACERKAQLIGQEYKYDIWGGCFIKDGDRWYEYDQQRVIK